MTWRALLVALVLTGCRCGAEPSVDVEDASLAPTRRQPPTPRPSRRGQPPTPRPSRRGQPPTPTLRRDDHGLPPEQGERALAWIDGRAITVLDFLDDYERLRGTDRLRFAMPAQRGALLERRLREELLADEARRRGLATLPEVTRAREAAMRHVLVADLRREHTPVAPTEPELLALYAEEPERWFRPTRARAEWVRGTREEAEAALAHARAARDPLRAMREWADRASSPTVSRGQLGPFAHPRSGWREAIPVPRAFAEAAHETPPGRLHPEVVEADGSFWVVYPLVREPETRIPFEEARDDLVRLHAERAFERMLDHALSDARVEIDERALATVRRP